MHNQVGCGFIMCIAVCLDMKVMSLQQISNSNSCSSGSIQLYEDTALQLVNCLYWSLCYQVFLLAYTLNGTWIQCIINFAVGS